ncbi:MAG: pyrroloquinoline quinone biosynthesis peptide chaperone PqqD [Methylotenera sp.]
MEQKQEPTEGKINHSDVYAIALHHRFQWEEAQQSYVILFPEGMVKLHGGAGEVIKRLDGKATVGEVIADLKQAFPDAVNIEADIIGMFELAFDKTWIRKL